MKYVVFVSVDKPERWGQWHSGPTAFVYYSNFLETEKDVEQFVERIKQDYPDSNLIDDTSDHEYFIKNVILQYDENDTEGFRTLCRMMNAYGLYKNRNN